VRRQAPAAADHRVTVLVTDGNQRSTLAITRSLGRRAIRVVVGEAAPHSMASSSRYSGGRIRYPSPYEQPEAFWAFLRDFLPRNEVDVLIPITDVTTRIVAEHEEEITRHARVVVPGLRAFDVVSDKWQLLQHARQAGIPIPETHAVHGPSMLPGVLSRLRYPVVLKPARSWTLAGGRWRPAGVQYAASEHELRRLYGERADLQGLALIQERIVGPGLGVSALFDRGTPVALFSHRRLRELPPSGGISVLRESVPLDPRLKEQTLRLLAPLGWHGVAMAEYKLDVRTGIPVLMEVNGRFWGSLQLAIDAGIDFPFLVYCIAIGRPYQAPDGYRVGVKTRWLVGDIMHAAHRVLRRDAAQNLPRGFPSKGATLLSLLKIYEPGLRYEDVAGCDPVPFLFEIAARVRHRIGRNRGDA
jgi:predicted ATP-grasp superfamily ATP-dependent carboligase